HANGEYLFFLINDNEVISPFWIREMLGFCQRENTAAVGAKLYYADDQVQHAGVVIGIGGFAGHVHPFCSRADTGYLGRLKAVQDISAVTAACMMVKRSVFESIDGFDENFVVALNDVDLCLRIREKGYLIVMDPNVELYHYESKSRGYEDTPEKQERFQNEIRRFQNRWKGFLEKGDPYYSPHLTLRDGGCGIRQETE
ncbi:MAG: glycosyltransferase, partial [Lachnospiraceae bacterium]|nr:glycosyltransferase [Lachnospiraceae bacterium]